MTGGTGLRAAAGFLLLLLAHFSVRPLVGGPVFIDFLSIAVLFSAVRVRPGVAAVIGFAVGIAIDSLSLDAFGTMAMAYTTVSYVASRSQAAFFSDHLSLTALFVLLGKWSADAIAILLTTGIPDRAGWVQLSVWSPLSGALTAVVAVMLLVVARPLFASSAARRVR
jgi:rod shape-determining protein MreD